MQNVLKQSTAVVVSFGPFLDKADAVTLETGLVSALDHGTTGIMLSKNGGTLAVRHASVTASEYDAHGCYKVTLDTTDTGTLGSLRMIYTDAATCLPVWQDFKVVPANVYDALVAGSDLLDVNTAQWLGTAPATPTTAGVPEVDVTHVAGTAQTAGDLKATLDDVPTAAENRAEMDSNSTKLEAIATDAAAIETQVGIAGAGLTAIPAGTLTADYDAAKTAAQAGDAMALTAGERTTLTAVVWDALLTGITTVGSIGRRIKDFLDVAVSSITGGVAGAGADDVTLTVNTTALDPIADCACWISSDADGSTVIAGTLYTNASGQVTFKLDAGLTYYLWRAKSGVNFTNPQSFVAVAD